LNDARFVDQRWIATLPAADRNSIMEPLYHFKKIDTALLIRTSAACGTRDQRSVVSF
jgi:hypothetical protein